MRQCRVYEIARELDLSSAEALRRLRAAGVAAKSHQSNVDRDQALAALKSAGSDSARMDTPHSPAPPSAPAKRGRRRRRSRNQAVPGTVVIKKYGNRRLYSTDESRYLTLDELERLIRSGTSVQVLDAASGEDITAQILTQILLEGGRASSLPVSFLEQLIRLSRNALQSYVSGYLMTGLDMFLGAQREIERRYQQSLSGFGMWPFGGFGDWLPSQQTPGQPGPSWPAGQPAPSAYSDPRAAPVVRPAQPPPPSGDDSELEVARLRQRLEQLEQRLGADRTSVSSKKHK